MTSNSRFQNCTNVASFAYIAWSYEANGEDFAECVGVNILTSTEITAYQAISHHEVSEIFTTFDEAWDAGVEIAEAIEFNNSWGGRPFEFDGNMFRGPQTLAA